MNAGPHGESVSAAAYLGGPLGIVFYPFFLQSIKRWPEYAGRRPDQAVAAAYPDGPTTAAG